MLPDPVRRYLAFAVPPDARAVRTVRLRHDGFFRPNPGPRWFPIRGEQHFTIDPPGFVWSARMRVLPLVWVAARDSLEAGQGHMLVKLNSIFTLADARGAEIDQGARARWLAEAVWFPSAFAGDAVRWEAIDDQSARVTLSDGGLPVSLVAEFDDAGRAVRVRGERYRSVEGGRTVLTAWSGCCSEYRAFDGFQVPASVEASWDLEGGQFTYARFRVSELEYGG